MLRTLVDLALLRPGARATITKADADTVLGVFGSTCHETRIKSVFLEADDSVARVLWTTEGLFVNPLDVGLTIQVARHAEGVLVEWRFIGMRYSLLVAVILTMAAFADSALHRFRNDFSVVVLLLVAALVVGLLRRRRQLRILGAAFENTLHTLS